MPDFPDPPAPPSGPRSVPAYGLAAGAGAALALFIDRPHLREQLREDALASGYRVVEAGSLAAFAARGRPSTAAVVLIDCPAPGAAELAALARQDLCARQRGTQLIVSTGLDALEEVFGCLDQSHPQLLVDPTPADFALALGRALAFAGHGPLRELREADRLLLLRLVEQVSRLAERLDRLETQGPDGPADRLQAPALAFRGADEPWALGAPQAAPALPAPALPDPACVRRLLRQRQRRAAFFGPDLFADPAWDMLLDLTAARGERKRVSVTSLCIAAGVPATTALRWIAQLSELGLFVRINDPADRRRAFIDLSDKAAAAMARYFAGLEETAER